MADSRPRSARCLAPVVGSTCCRSVGCSRRPSQARAVLATSSSNIDGVLAGCDVAVITEAPRGADRQGCIAARRQVLEGRRQVERSAQPVAGRSGRGDAGLGPSVARSGKQARGRPTIERPESLRVFGPPTGLSYRRDTPAVLQESEHSLEFQEARGDEALSLPMPRALANLTLGDFTIAAWFRTADAGRGVLMGSCCGNPKGALNLELHTSNRLRLWISGPEKTTDLNTGVGRVGKIADDSWHFAAGVRRGKSVETLPGRRSGWRDHGHRGIVPAGKRQGTISDATIEPAALSSAAVSTRRQCGPVR